MGFPLRGSYRKLKPKKYPSSKDQREFRMRRRIRLLERKGRRHGNPGYTDRPVTRRHAGHRHGRVSRRQ
jgi:hypothetical protein